MSAALASVSDGERHRASVLHVVQDPHAAHEPRRDGGREENAPDDDRDPLAPVEEACLRLAARRLGVARGGRLLEDQERGGMHDELEPHDVNGQVQERVPGQRDQGGSHHQRDVHQEEILEALLQVPEELLGLRDRAHDGPEVVVHEDDRGDVPGAAGRTLAHRDADVRGLQRRHVVHAVPRDGDDLTFRLQRLHERQLLRRHRARDRIHAGKCAGREPVGTVPNLVRDEHTRRAVGEPDLARHGGGRAG